jgi:DNA-directed RNA polymerase subunit RPC12/RpoP
MKNVFMTDVGFFECPSCGNLTESLLRLDENSLKCVECQAIFEHAPIRVLKKPAVLCRDCNLEVSFTPGNQDWGAGKTYICPKCTKVVAYTDETEKSGSVCR